MTFSFGDILKSIRRNGYLMRMLAVMIVFCIVPLFIMQAMATNLIEKEMKEEFANAQNESLSYVTDKTRNAIRNLFGTSIALDQVHEYIKFASITEKEMLYWENIKAPYTDEELEGMYDYIMLKDKVSRMLTNTAMVAPYISSVEFFDLNKNWVLNDERTYKPISMYEDVVLLSYVNQKGLFPIITPVREIKGRHIVSIVSKSLNYAVSINIDMDEFGSTILDNHPEYTKIIVYDDRGNYLFGTDYLEQCGNYSEMKDRYSFVSHTDRLVPYWEYWSLLDLSMIKGRIDEINMYMTIVSVILMLLSFVVSYLAAKKLYRPAAEISRLIEGETVDEETGDIFNRMFNYVESSRKERGRMQNDIETLKPFYEERKILGLMYGHGSSADMDYVLGSKGGYVLFAFRMSSAENKSSTEEEEYLMRERLSELSWGFFGEPGHIMHDFSGKYYFLISVTEDETKKEKSFAVIAREFIEEKFDFKCRVGISGFQCEISALPLAKKEADEALTFAVLSDRSSIGTITDSKDATLTRFDHIEHLFSIVMDQLKEGTPEAACRTLKKVNGDLEQISGSLRIGKITELFLHMFTFMLEQLSKAGKAESTPAELIKSDYKLILEGNLMKPSSDIEEIMLGYCSAMNECGTRKADSIDNVMKLIEQNYTRNLGLVDYADMIGMHPDYLGRSFKNKTGWSFVEYITSKRIEEAEVLLSNPEAKVKDVSAAVGFSNSNYFIKVFKNATGMTPKEFQLKNAENYQTKE